MLITDHIVKLHQKFDGVCQECSQRCDKSVITVKQKEAFEIIISPDCLAERTKVVFKVSDQFVSNLLTTLPDYSVDDLKAMLFSFSHQYALVKYHTDYRIYWSWDKSQPFKTIHTDHVHQIKWVTFYNNELNKKFSNKNKNNINGTQYNYAGQRVIPVSLITISEDLKNTTPSCEKINRQIDYYRKNGQFRGIKVERIGAMKWSLLDGYSRYLAAKQIGVTHVVTEELSRTEDLHPIEHEEDTIFLTYASLRKSKSSQEHSVDISIHRWKNARIKKKFSLNFGSFSNYEDALFAVNMSSIL
ncbi:hypothetical protein [Brevibacillus centrosporus]|uniref:hypothetical protein n=1 Tax=Brevibacillus centrosporus TaxID=54910 RepID=UPI003B01AB0D